MHGRLTIGQHALYVVSIFTDHRKNCLLKPPVEAPQSGLTDYGSAVRLYKHG